MLANKQTGNKGCRGLAGPGRPKGSRNKVSGLLKEAILLAAENAGNQIGNEGLVSYLEEQAIQHPAAFMTLLGKVLPMQVTGDLRATEPPPPVDKRKLAKLMLLAIAEGVKEAEKLKALEFR